MGFELQAYLGLRISEAVRVRLDDIDLNRKTIRVINCKTREVMRRELHDVIFWLVKSYVERFGDYINEHQGYLIWSNYDNGKEPHLGAEQMRKRFREASDNAGLTETYAVLDNVPGQPGTCRKLRRLSTHSLRHFFISSVYAETLDPILTMKAARHTQMSSTMHYLDSVDNKVEKGVQQAFSNMHVQKPVEKKQTATGIDMNEFMEVLQLYKQLKAAGRA